MSCLDTFDVIVTGGGPAGSLMALQLTQRRLRVMVLEKQATAIWKVGDSLPSEAKTILGSVGIDNKTFSAGHYSSRGHASAWGESELIFEDYLRNMYGPGWYLNRQKFEEDLEASCKTNGVKYLRGAKLVSVCKKVDQSAQWQLTYRIGETDHHACCKYIADATGRSRTVTKMVLQSSLSSVAHDRLIAMITKFVVNDELFEKKNLFSSHVESVENGWWYCNFIPDKTLILIFHTDDDLPIARTTRTGKGFLQVLQETACIWPLVKEIVQPLLDSPPRPSCVQANSSLLPSCGSKAGGWIAVGDAAIAFDPLSSHGLLSALLTGVAAANAIDKTEHFDDDSIERYSKAVQTLFERYLQKKAYYYGLERRWNQSLFWKRRHQ